MGILKHHHLYIQYKNIESPSSTSIVCKYWNIIYIFSMGILKHHQLYLISNVEMSDFYVLRWSTGFSVIFIQLWLSHRITVVSNKLDITFRIHMASQLAEQAAMYFASVMLRVILDCFLLNHEIVADPKQKHPPDLCFLYETLPSQSVYPYNL